MKRYFSFFRVFFISFFFLISCKSLFAQVKQIDDPLLTHPNYISADAGMNYMCPNYAYRNAVINGVGYNMGNNLNGAYQPMASVEIGHVFIIKAKDPVILRLNSGLSITSYSINIIGAYNTTGTLSETFLQVPLAISTHIPLKVFQAQSRYHALELKLGSYYDMNIKREIQDDFMQETLNKTDFQVPGGKYSKINVFAEAGISFTSPNGHSHEIGLRVAHDMGQYFMAKGANELPFLYNSAGIFYRWTFYCF